MSVDVLQHTLNRYGVVTVMDVKLLDPVTKDLLLELDTLKISSITADGSTKEIRGGLKADLLVTFNHSRSLAVEIQDALLSPYSLKQLWGGKLVTDKVKFSNSITFTATNAANKLVFSGSASGPNDINMIDKNYQIVTKDKGGYFNIYNKTTGEKLQDSQYTITNNANGETVDAIAFTSGVSKNDVIVLHFEDTAVKGKNTSGYNPTEVTLTSNSFPSAMILVGKTVVIEQKTQKQVLAEIEIPRFQLGNNFAFTMDAEGDASTFNFSGFGLVEPDSKSIIKMKHLAYVTGVLE